MHERCLFNHSLNMIILKSRLFYRIVVIALSAVTEAVTFMLKRFSEWIEHKRDTRLVLAKATPVTAYTDFRNLKESAIESKTIVDSRGRVLGQVKLWIYHDSRQCFREVTFLNVLLRTSVGLTRLSFKPIYVGVEDTPAVLIEVTVREFENWLRNRTAGTQFGIEAARIASEKPEPLKVTAIPIYQQQPGTSVNAGLPKFADAPSSTSKPLASATRDKVPESAPLKLKPKVLECSRGILTWFGIAKRRQGERTFDQFCVDLTLTDGDAQGVTKRLWGTDLERALTDSCACTGQLIEVLHHGSVQQPNATGGDSYKNMFSMLVLP